MRRGATLPPLSLVAAYAALVGSGGGIVSTHGTPFSPYALELAANITLCTPRRARAAYQHVERAGSIRLMVIAAAR